MAAIVRVANAENPDTGRAVVDHMMTALQSYLQNGAFKNLKLVLRFFACLGDVMGDHGVAPVLDRLIDGLPAYHNEGNEVRLVPSSPVRGFYAEQTTRDCSWSSSTSC